MKFNYLRLMQEESADLAAFLDELPGADWNAATLCRGWRVREVVSHMAVGHTISLGAYAGVIARAGFRIDRASDILARRYAAQHTPDEITALFRRGTSGRPTGPTAFVARAELFTDHLVHHQDIRRPLGRRRNIPEVRLVAALHSLHRLSARTGSKARMRGLRIEADDVDFTVGQGAPLRGPAEALVLALCGREAATADLRGEGAALLTRRLRAEEVAVAPESSYPRLVALDAGESRPKAGELS